jgi:UDP-N-acetylmuramate dehydrogenase
VSERAVEEVAGALTARLGERVTRDEPVGPLTTYRVGGPASVLVRLEDDADLTAVAAIVAGSGVDVLVVGRGSNLLVSDAGFPGVALVLGEGFAQVEIDATGPSLGAGGEVSVRAGGAASLPVVARRTAAAGLRGFEWAVGVPGSIGGAVRMNAGGHGSDMAATLRRVRVCDVSTGEDGEVDAERLALSYRGSAISTSQVVVWADLALRPGDPTEAAAEIDEIVRWRRENQPGGPNAGSVFTNPAGDSAGRLIDAAGCKGARVGTAEVSTKHANFIQADAGGRADDVWALMALVRDRVRDEFGVVLEPETRLVGFDRGLR